MFEVNFVLPVGHRKFPDSETVEPHPMTRMLVVSTAIASHGETAFRDDHNRGICIANDGISCHTRVMFLSHQTIEKYIDAGTIIIAPDFDKKNIRPVGVRIH